MRQLILIDLENLVSDARHAGAADFQDVLGRIVGVTGARETDHVVLGANPGLLTAFFTAKACWPTIQLRPRHGRDGADHALLAAAADLHQVRRTFDRVVVASGDGIFATLALQLRAFEVPTLVLSRPEKLSLELWSVADDVVLLDTDMAFAW